MIGPITEWPMTVTVPYLILFMSLLILLAWIVLKPSQKEHPMAIQRFGDVAVDPASVLFLSKVAEKKSCILIKDAKDQSVVLEGISESGAQALLDYFDAKAKDK